MLSAFFGIPQGVISELADYLLSRARRRPLLAWEKRDKGYSSAKGRTLFDALTTLRYENCKVLESIKFKLRPNDDEIVAIITINLIDEEREKARTIANSVLKAVPCWRYWAAFLEPTTDGLPHRTLLIRLPRRGLRRLEKHIQEEKAEVGFSSSIDLAICDSESWHGHKQGHWPWPIGYNSAGAYNLTYILSFTAWVNENGGRWYHESRKCLRLESDQSHIGYVPSKSVQNFPTESTPDVIVTLPPLADPAEKDYYNFQKSEARRNTRLIDEKAEWEGRNLNDSLCNQNYAKSLSSSYPDLILPSGLPNPELDKKYIDLIEKALETRDESVLAIIRASLQAEADARKERTEKPQRECENRIKALWAAFSRTSKAIRKKSRDKAVFSIATSIHNAVKSEDREALKRFGFDRRNSLVFDLQEVKIISQEISQKIEKYDGASELEHKKIMREINSKLREHLHTLMFAELHIFIQKFREKVPFLNGLSRQLADEALVKIDEKIGTHRKATLQGHWLKKAIIKAMGGNVGRLNEMLEEIDFRSDNTRVRHGRKPLKDGVILAEDHKEVKSRTKTKGIRKIEVEKAEEAAEKAALPRVRKPRQPRKKQAEKPTEIAP